MTLPLRRWMRHPSRTLLLVQLTALLLPGISLAADDSKEADAPKAKLSQFSLGKKISGDEVTIESLAGKPVVLEFWGIH